MGLSVAGGEELLTMAQLARLVPGRKGRASPATLYRWATRGMANPAGQRVYLESTLSGQLRCSSVAALQRFLDALNAGREGMVVVNPPPDATRACLEAEAELIRRGM